MFPNNKLSVSSGQIAKLEIKKGTLTSAIGFSDYFIGRERRRYFKGCILIPKHLRDKRRFDVEIVL